MLQLPDWLGSFLSLTIFVYNGYTLKVSTVFFIVVIMCLTKVALGMFRTVLLRKQKLTLLDLGSSYALYKIISYIIWIVVIAVCLDTVGVNLNVFIAGSAALLVGIGLGLQQTFNDIVSGIILLVERKTRVNDVLEVDGDVVRIKSIGIRTSTVENRNYISQIIPNSMLTNYKVINWSHQSLKTRFSICVGVAYGSNIDLVCRLMEECVTEHPKVANPDVRLNEFADSSLNFEMFFVSEEIFYINVIKSDLRKILNRKFNENGVTIPFPQRDLHIIPAQNTQMTTTDQNPRLTEGAVENDKNLPEKDPS